LEDAYPEELLKLKVRLEKTPFTDMGVTKNYVFAAHMDRDILHFVISWFIRSILYFPSVEISEVPKRRFLNFMTTYYHKTFVHELYIMALRQ
jgi:hypothetical protein